MSSQESTVNEINQALITTLSAQKEISLILLYGSRAKGTHSPKSDVEYIVVLETNRGNKLSFECIYKGIPVSLFSISWEQLNKIASRDEYWILPAGSYVSAKVIYSRSEDDLACFKEFQTNLGFQERFESKHLDNALHSYDKLTNALGQMLIAKRNGDIREARKAGWELLIAASFIVGHINQRYYLNNWGDNLYEAFEFQSIPHNFKQLTNIISHIADIELMLQSAVELVNGLRMLLIDKLEGKEANDAHELEILKPNSTDALSYNNKIRKAAQKEDIIAASYAVHDFQILMVRDLLKQSNKWDKASKLRLYSDLMTEYMQQGFPDFNHLISQRDFKKMLEVTDRVEKELEALYNPDHQINEYGQFLAFINNTI